MTKIEIFTDGAAKGNPGPGGYGALIRYRDPKGEVHEKVLSEGYRHTTNNRMELMAVIVALECLNRPCVIELYSDSAYITNAFNQHWIESWIKAGWKRGKSDEVKNIDLWQRLLAAAEPHEITWNWVKGHAGHPENVLCDKLASDAALRPEEDQLEDVRNIT